MKAYNFIVENPPLVLILAVIFASILAVISALLGEYWWGVLGRLGVTAPLSWIWGFIIGLGQVVAVYCYLAPKVIEWDRKMSGVSDE